MRNINGKPKLNKHIKEGPISWTEITEDNYILSLADIIQKFKGMEGHYVLIIGSCQINMNTSEYNNDSLKFIKGFSMLYKNKKYKLNLNCFQDLYKIIKNDEEVGIRRIQDLSSTYKKEANCYIELMSKYRKMYNSMPEFKNGRNRMSVDKCLQRYPRGSIPNRVCYYIKDMRYRYENSILFDFVWLFYAVKTASGISEKEIEEYYKKRENNVLTPEEKRLQRYENSLLTPNNVPMPNFMGTGGNKKEYVYIKNIGKRLIRYYKNGKRYYIHNGIKRKL